MKAYLILAQIVADCLSGESDKASREYMIRSTSYAVDGHRSSTPAETMRDQGDRHATTIEIAAAAVAVPNFLKNPG